ncbi:DUF6282 family protein [Actibacterium sp.]|uniref:DUF6282 family protein n=1 Tax=Actibacterium sp. TaxID=1872125 RepID=UPI00356A8F16
MAGPSDLPDIVPLSDMPADRRAHVDELLQGAVDLHCHSGPSAMPRILGHHQAFQEAQEAGFKALLYKDHYYVGMNHCTLLQEVYPDMKTKVFSGVALNNATGGVNPHAVDHCVKMGGKIVWMPTFSAANHLSHYSAKTFPKTAKKMLEPIPLKVTDDKGNLTPEALDILDLIAEGDIILSGGHLHISEMLPLYQEAKKRGVKKMLINHPTYLIDCTDDDMRALSDLGAYMEHSICMFIESRVKFWDANELKRLIDVVGADKTVLGSDLGLTQAPKPVDGFREIVSAMIDVGISDDDIRKVTSRNAAGLLGLT